MNVLKVASRIWPVTGRDWHPAWRTALALVLTIAVLHPVLAQAPLPGFVPIPPIPVPAGSPIERMTPRQLPSVSPNGMNLSPIEEGEVPNIPIAVRRVEIVGVSLFNAELRPYLDGLTGPATPLPQAIDRGNGIVRYTVTGGASPP